MAALTLILFDDRVARDWMPFVLTRPAGELRFGALTLRERVERVLGAHCAGHLVDDHLRTYEEPGAPAAVDLARLPAARDHLFLSSRAVPAWGATLPRFGPDPTLLRVGGHLSGWYAPAGAEFPPDRFFDDPAAFNAGGLSTAALDGELLGWPWHLIARNAVQLGKDIAALFPDAPYRAPPAGVHVLGDAPLILGHGVEIEPGVVIDLRDGPVWLDDRVRVRAFTRLAGPAYVGRDTVLLGGPFSAVSIGPVCKLHGEIEETIVLGYSNKAHDGFLGHAYVGCWVNLGALTTNSDLKNNYGPVRIATPTGEVDTGESKLGCLLGDHVKTAIGTLLNTGTVVGAGSNIFGTGMPPKSVPAFCWGAENPPRPYALEKFLATAETVMARRNVRLSEGQRSIFRAAWDREWGHRP